jgi:predicted kinase
VTRLTRAEAADLAGVRPDTFGGYVTRGQAPAPAEHVGRTPLWDADAVRLWAGNRSGQGARNLPSRQDRNPGQVSSMPRETPAIHAIVVTGAPASGKSTIGRALARHFRAALIDQDTATAPLVDVVAHLVGVHDLDDPALANATRAARYETVVALAEENLRLGTSVVLVAPFTAERRDVREWSALQQRLRAAGGKPTLVWLRLGAEVVVERLRSRGALRDAAKLADAGAYAAALDLAEPAFPHVTVDAEATVEGVLDGVLAALKN